MHDFKDGVSRESCATLFLLVSDEHVCSMFHRLLNVSTVVSLPLFVLMNNES